MKRVWLGVIVVLAMALPAFAQTLEPKEPPWRRSAEERSHSVIAGTKLAHLAKYIGTYDLESILNDPDVKAEIVRLMEGDLPDLLECIEVRRPVTFYASPPELVLEAWRANMAGSFNTMMLISLDGEIEIALTIGGTKRVYVGSRLSGLNVSFDQWAYGPEIREVIWTARKTNPVEIVHRPRPR